MSRTQYFTATSLDGFIADADHSLEWLFALGDPADTSYPTFIKDIGAIVMGSGTYEWLLRNAIHATPPQPWPYEMPTWIFTMRQLEMVPGANLRFVQGDVRAAHADMVRAAGGKNVWVCGGGDLAGQFHDAGLLDDLFIQIGSATLGAGKPLLPRRINAPALALRSARAIGTTFVELHYEIQRDAAHG
jgi:dihydrofolate reductase